MKGRKKTGNFDSNQYINDYIKNNYDRIHLNIPKGKRDVIKEYANKQGTSTSQYIYQAILDRLRRDGYEQDDK